MDQSSSEQPAPKKKKKKRAPGAEPTEASGRREAPPPPPPEHWVTTGLKNAGVKILALLLAVVVFAIIKSCQEKGAGEQNGSLDAPDRGEPAALASRG